MISNDQKTTPAIDLLARVTLAVTTILTGLSAGFFYTFEASVTLGLDQVGDQVYVETFQAINDTIRNAGFGIVFFGSIPALALTLALNWRRVSPTGRVLLLAAGGAYLIGLAITVGGNIPLNRDLAEVATLDQAEISAARAAFEDDWNRLNLLRTFAFGSAFAALAILPALVGGRWRSAGNQTGEAADGPAIGHNR